MATDTQEPEQIVTEYAAIWNEQTFDRLPEVVTESFTFTSPPAGTVQGLDAVKAYARQVVDGFSDFKITPHEMLSEGQIVMTESTLSGTHDGDFKGVPPTHETFEIKGMAKFVAEDGKLQSERSYFDQQEFLRQLGLADG